MQRVTSKTMLSVGAMIIVTCPDRSARNPCGIINTIKSDLVSFTDPITQEVHDWSLADMGIEPYEVDEEHPFWGTYLVTHEQERTNGHRNDTCIPIAHTVTYARVQTRDTFSLLYQ